MSYYRCNHIGVLVFRCFDWLKVVFRFSTRSIWCKFLTCAVTKRLPLWSDGQCSSKHLFVKLQCFRILFWVFIHKANKKCLAYDKFNVSAIIFSFFNIYIQGKRSKCDFRTQGTTKSVTPSKLKSECLIQETVSSLS